jgi:hypothetical protein
MWKECQAEVAQEVHVLEPFRQYMSEYFEYVADKKQLDQGRLERCPLIGLSFDLDTGCRLAVRAGWKKATHRNDGSISFGVWNPQIVTIELVKSGPPLKNRLSPGEIRVERCSANAAQNEVKVSLLLDIADRFLRNPIDTVAKGHQANACCVCGKPLTDYVSRTRGIGPECIKWFTFFEQESAVAKQYVDSMESTRRMLERVVNGPDSLKAWEEYCSTVNKQMPLDIHQAKAILGKLERTNRP